MNTAVENRPLIWVSVAELSGDMHAADLLEALHVRRPDLIFRGIAGPCLRERFRSETGEREEALAASASLQNSQTGSYSPKFSELFGIEQLSIMGGTEVLSAIPRILRMWAAIRRDLQAQRPDAVILVDGPDFNFKIAKIAHALGIPVYYYISPKIWAWRSGRAHFLKRHVRRVLSILPFEPEFYRGFGMEVPYVGNPLVAAMDLPALDKIVSVPGRIGLMPGSRKKEVSVLMPLFGAAARLIQAARPDVSFHCIQAPGISAEMLHDLWQSDIPFSLEPAAERYQFIRSCDCILAASGTATLECALAGTPTVVTYKLSALTGWLASKVLNVRFVSLPNLIMDREVFPELLQGDARPELLAAGILRWLDDAGARAQVALDLQEIRRRLGTLSAPGEAAGIILQDCGLLD